MFALFERYGKYVLQKAIAKHRKRDGLSLSNATTACVILSDNELISVQAKKIAARLKEQNPELIITFCSFKKKIKEALADVSSQKKKPSIDLKVISAKDINWYGRPKNEAMRNASCDILIDLTEKAEMPLQFLAVMSNATMKIGVEQDYNKDYLHLMIQKGDEWKPEYILEQLIHYLNLINTKNDAA